MVPVYIHLSSRRSNAIAGDKEMLRRRISNDVKYLGT
jgi:hypothetical protein